MSIEQRLAIEHGVTNVLADSNSIAVAAPETIRTICETLGWTCGSYWGFDPLKETMVCVATWGAAGDGVGEFLKASRQVRQSTQSGGLIRRAWLEGAPVWVRDVTADESFHRAPAALKAGLRSAFAFPVKAGPKVIGVVELFSREIHQPDADLLDCTQYIGSQIGQFCQRTEAQERLRESEAQFQSTIELAAIGICHVDAEGRYLHVNRWMCDLLGYSRQELLGMSVKQVSHPDDKNVTDEVRAKLRAGLINSFQMEKRYLRKDGSVVWVRLTISVMRAPSGEPLHDITITEDISERKQAEEALRLSEERFRSLATHDDLSGLPNRIMFSELLRLEIASAQRHRRRFAVLFIDLDRFKEINDSLGHAAGDDLLREIAARLKGALRASDVVARLGGDEFIVLAQEAGDGSCVAAVARKILSAVIEPMVISGQECRVSASVGIAMYPEDAQDELSLVNRADVAMYLAKAEGKNNFQFYAERVKS